MIASVSQVPYYHIDLSYQRQQFQFHGGSCLVQLQLHRVRRFSAFIAFLIEVEY